MHESTGQGIRSSDRLHARTLVLWALLGAAITVPVFFVLHSLASHAFAVAVASAAAVVVSAAGYALTTRDRSGYNIALAAGLGGVLGLAALHLVPLLH